MNNEMHTDILLTAENLPLVTLTESKIPNTWYHIDTDRLFCLTSNGFKHIKGSKKQLENMELI